MKKIIALAALVAVSATASAATNLFTNGSFEDNVLASGTWNTFQSVDGWLVTTASGAKSPHGLEIRNGIDGTAQDGNNFIELDGYENDRITTAFATTIGQQYQITFWYADRDGVAADSEGFTARVVSGSLSPAYTKGAVGAPGWVEETIDFTAGSDLSIFTIKADGKSDSLGTSFDNFQAIAVPEPATLGMFAAGLAMLGLSARRRSK